MQGGFLVKVGLACIREGIEGMQDKCAVEVYKGFHRLPELSWKEDFTIIRIIQEAKKFGYRQVVKKGGIWFDHIVDQNNPFYLFRAEVDALPLQEETELTYSSRKKGVMHACGHDMHMAMLLAVMKELSGSELSSKHNIRFVFQRAEERGPSGAKSLIEQGVLDGVSKVFGLHICSELPLGVFYVREGMFLARSSSVEIYVKTPYSHTSANGEDTFSLIDEIWQTVSAFGRRNKSVLIKRRLQNSTRHEGTLKLAIRSHLTESQYKTFCDELKKEVKAYNGVFDSKVTLKFLRGHPPVVNTINLCQEVMGELIEQGEQVQVAEQHFASDDFGYFGQHRPANYVVVGACDTDTPAAHHTPYFNPSPEVMKYGIRYWLYLASRSS